MSFLPDVPDPADAAKLVATAAGGDRLAVIDREVHWLLGGPRAESDHSEASTVNILGMPTTRRAIAPCGASPTSTCADQAPAIASQSIDRWSSASSAGGIGYFSPLPQLNSTT